MDLEDEIYIIQQQLNKTNNKLEAISEQQLKYDYMVDKVINQNLKLIEDQAANLKDWIS